MKLRAVSLGLCGSLMLLLSACGGGGGGGGASGSSAPSAPELTVTATAQPTSQSLDLTWAAVSGATAYRVELDADGSGAYQTVASGLASSTLSYRLPVSVHRLDWNNARIRVQACNADACSASGSQAAASALLAAVAYVKASNTQDNQSFGSGMALSADGKTLVVGAPNVNDEAEGIFPGGRAVTGATANQHGAVYVYTQDVMGRWSQAVYLKAPNILDVDGNPQGGFDSGFGASVAVSGDGTVIAVGAPNESSLATGIDGDLTSYDLNNAGAVFVFTRDSGGNWTGPVYIKASNTRDDQLFGTSLSLSRNGDQLVVGAPGDDSVSKGVNGNQSVSGNPDSGAAYVFALQGGVWTQTAFLKASNARPDSRFGLSVALSGNGGTLLVSAPDENGVGRGVNSNQNATGVDGNGAAYVFTRGTGVSDWTQQAYIKPSNTPLVSDGVDGIAFGSGISITNDGNLIAIGAPYIDSDSATESSNANSRNLGAVYLFMRTGSAWSQKVMLKTPVTGDFANMGSSVSLSADGAWLVAGTPGDASLLKGVTSSPSFTSGINDSGGAFLFKLEPSGAGTLKSYIKPHNTLTDKSKLWGTVRPQFGSLVSLNSDGSRLAVSAPGEYGNGRGVYTGVDVSGTDTSRKGAGAVYLY